MDDNAGPLPAFPEGATAAAAAAGGEDAQEYLQKHGIPDIMQHLCYALLKSRPADHTAFTKWWLSDLKEKLSKTDPPGTLSQVQLQKLKGTRKKVRVSTTRLHGHRHVDSHHSGSLTRKNTSRGMGKRDAKGSRADLKGARADLLHHLHSLLEDVTEDGLQELIRVAESNQRLSSKDNSETSRAPTHGMGSVVSKKAKPAGLERTDSPTLNDIDSPASPHVPNTAAMKVTEGPKRRIAISATPIEVEKVHNFVAKIIPKSEEDTDKLNECVKTSTLFSSFEPEERDVVVKAMNPIDFPAGENVLKQGDPSKDTFFLIMEGTVEVIKNGKVVASMGPGQYFGELELMYNTGSCAATIQTVTPVKTFGLDKETYQNIVLHNTLARRHTFLAQINKVEFLVDLPEYDKMTLAEALTTTTYQPGDMLIRCGEEGLWMYVLMEGTVQVVGRENGKKVNVIQLGAGEVVGELEFLFNHPTVADVVAITKVKVAKLNRKHFEMCMGPVADNLKRIVAKGKYDHYLQQAGESVKKEIEDAEKRHDKKVAPVSGLHGEDDAPRMDFHEEGEIVFGSDSQTFRFPFNVLATANIAVIGLQEDGTVVHWNDCMARATNYMANHVHGGSIFSFLLSVDHQQRMHKMIKTAQKWAGNWDGFVNSGLAMKELLVFSQNGALSKVSYNFVVVPPLVAQPSDKAEVVLAIGTETKRKAPVQNVDFLHWLFESLRPPMETLHLALSDLEKSHGASIPELSSALEQSSECGRLVEKYEPLSKINAAQVAESWTAVNVRVLFGRLQTEATAHFMKAGNVIQVEIADTVPQEVYMDSVRLPETLAHLLKNAARFGKSAKVYLSAGVVETGMTKTIVYAIEDEGQGIAPEILETVKDEKLALSKGRGKGMGLAKIKMSTAVMGGILNFEKARNGTGTKVTLSFPLVATEESHDETDHAKRAMTTVMVESDAIHRNMLCHHLWERHHAVVPATTWREISAMIETNKLDILIVDPDCIVEDTMTQSFKATDLDPMAMLKQHAAQIAVIVTSESFDDDMTKAYDKEGLLALAKPFTAARLHTIIMRAEEQVATRQEESEKITALRETFTKTNRGTWKRGKLLGKGAFGDVFEAIDVLTQGKMAVKSIRVTAANRDQMEELMNEIEVMRDLQHENIIHYFYCERTEPIKAPGEGDDGQMEGNGGGNINIFMEYASGGTLQDVIKKNAGVPMEPSAIAVYLRDIVNGLDYIHHQRFVHCDIKSANVLLGADGRCKLGDFGTAKQLKPGEKLYVMRGTPMYMAPEVMNADEEEKLGYEQACDIWSLGCVVLEMATGKPPFSHIQGTNSPMGLLRYISELTDTPDLSPLFQSDPSVFEFVKSCLEVDIEKRPSARQLKDFNLLSESSDARDGSSTVAVKLMNRAKLLHALNKFVAFQDPDEEETGSSDSGHIFTTRYQTRKASAFFADSSEEEEGEEGEEGESPKHQTQPTKVKKVTAAEFFSDSD